MWYPRKQNKLFFFELFFDMCDFYLKQLFGIRTPKKRRKERFLEKEETKDRTEFLMGTTHHRLLL